MMHEDDDNDGSFDLEDMLDQSYTIDSFREFLEKSPGEVDPSVVQGIKRMIDREFLEYKRSREDYIPKEYVGFEFAITAYQYILDNGGNREDALEFSRKIHDKSIEWINDVKNRPYFYTKKVVKKFDTHEEQKKMIANGTMDKSALMQRQSINQQLGRLSKSKQLSDTLEELKQSDKEQSKTIKNLTKTVTSSEIDITRLKELTGLEDIPPKDKAKILKNKGFNQKDIAEMTGKSLRTIKRWWKEL